MSAPAGYTGVTASGAGFSGLVPVRSDASTTANYDAVINAGRVSEPAAINYAVTTEEIVFTDAEAETFVAPSQDELTRYAYEWDVGPTSDFVTEEGAMTIMKQSPNVVFPFVVKGLRGERTIELDAVYDLRNVRLPDDRDNPVQVVESSPTSFTFLTLPGHFRGAGRAIKFTTMARDGRLLLRQEGLSSAGVADEVYDVGARIAWRHQADNLRAAIYGGTRADFPGTWPVCW